MSSSNYAIPSDDLSGGGGDTSASANYGLRDTAGQSVIGNGASADFATQQGYRNGATTASLTADFVDAHNNTIVSPSASFNAIAVGDTAAAGMLATGASKIHVTNTRAIAPWSLTIAATNGPASEWRSGTHLMSFNHPSIDNALTIDPSVGTITPVNLPCTANGLSLGAAATFDEDVTDSITLMTAGGAAQTQCGWDLTGVTMTQTIPQTQAPGSYSISMTITVA